MAADLVDREHVCYSRSPVKDAGISAGDVWNRIFVEVHGTSHPEVLTCGSLILAAMAAAVTTWVVRAACMSSANASIPRMTPRLSSYGR